MVRTARGGLAVAAIVIAAVLVGCTPAPAPAASAPTVATPSPTPTPTASGPVLVPDGTAADNLPLFTAIMNQVASTDQAVLGRAYVDALVAAGFDKTAMEVTQDRTTVGNPADSIQFSVRWKGECLVGQVGPSTPMPTALVLPEIPGGTCLIGQTRPIDW